MSSIQKLVNHWKQGQFIPGGKPPQPFNNEVKGQRLSELNGDDMIVPEITKGITILKDVVEALKITQEFNKDPTSFSGDARDVLMSEDFLLVANVLRLIFPEGMVSEVWQLKRGRDEDLDTRDDAYTPGNRQILIPNSKRLRFTNGPRTQEKKTGGVFSMPASQIRFTNGSKSQPEKKPGLFSMPASEIRFTNGSKSQPEKKPGLFSMPASEIRFTNGSESQPEKKPGLFSMPASEIRFTNGSESQPEKKPGLFSMPASEIRFTNGSESQPEKKPGLFGMSASQLRFANRPGTQPEDANIFGAKDKDTNNSPALQRKGVFSAKEPAPEYRGIFSQQIGFASNPVVSEGSEKVSNAPPTPPQTGPKHTESSSQYIGSLSGNNKEATLDKLLSSMGGDDVNKILAQLQLHQQGIKRKHEEEKEIRNKKQKNIQEPPSLIEL